MRIGRMCEYSMVLKPSMYCPFSGLRDDAELVASRLELAAHAHEEFLLLLRLQRHRGGKRIDADSRRRDDLERERARRVDENECDRDAQHVVERLVRDDPFETAVERQRHAAGRHRSGGSARRAADRAEWKVTGPDVRRERRAGDVQRGH